MSDSMKPFAASITSLCLATPVPAQTLDGLKISRNGAQPARHGPSE